MIHVVLELFLEDEDELSSRPAEPNLFMAWVILEESPVEVLEAVVVALVAAAAARLTTSMVILAAMGSEDLWSVARQEQRFVVVGSLATLTEGFASQEARVKRRCNRKVFTQI